MQIVIDIPDWLYEQSKHDKEVGKTQYGIEIAVADGIVLPSGHGDLIDRDMQDDVIMRLNENDWQITRGEYKRFDGILFEFPVIVPSDKEAQEVNWDDDSEGGLIDDD